MTPKLAWTEVVQSKGLTPHLVGLLSKARVVKLPYQALLDWEPVDIPGEYDDEEFPAVPFPVTWLEGFPGMIHLFEALGHVTKPEALAKIDHVGELGSYAEEVAYLVDRDNRQFYRVVQEIQDNRTVRFHIGQNAQFPSSDLRHLKIALAFMSRQCVWTDERLPGGGLKLRAGGSREHVRIKRIVRVVPRSERKAYEASVGRKVDWSHRWEVAGHWRSVAGVGKDPAGKYEVLGKTWVTNHEKGKKGEDAIPKLRVVT